MNFGMQETFWDLPLAFSSESGKQGITKREYVTNRQIRLTSLIESIDGMLESYFLPETLEGSNQYSCSTCKSLQNAEKVCFISFLNCYLSISSAYVS